MGDDSTADIRQLPEAVLNSVSANLRGARQRAGLSLEQLARRSELHPVGVKRVEDGATMPRLDTVVKLAGALDVPARRALRRRRLERRAPALRVARGASPRWAAKPTPQGILAIEE